MTDAHLYHNPEHFEPGLPGDAAPEGKSLPGGGGGASGRKSLESAGAAGQGADGGKEGGSR